jgi:phosphopantetheinyl transferase (holo-ACP synthase)
MKVYCSLQIPAWTKNNEKNFSQTQKIDCDDERLEFILSDYYKKVTFHIAGKLTAKETILKAKPVLLESMVTTQEIVKQYNPRLKKVSLKLGRMIRISRGESLWLASFFDAINLTR